MHSMHSMFSSLGISLNVKPVTLHETNYHYKAYIEKLLNYCSHFSSTHIISSFWYLDSQGNLKKTLVMPNVQITSVTINFRIIWKTTC